MDPETQLPGFQFIDHIGIAVPTGELERQVVAYEQLGFTEVHREDVLGTDLVREVLLRVGSGPSLVQLLEPLSPDSPIQKFIDRNGGRGGPAHLAFRVASADAAFEALQGAGVHLVDGAPRNGSRGTKVFFIHPKAGTGLLIEVVESAGDDL